MENLGEKITNVNEGTIKISEFAATTKEIVSEGILTIKELVNKSDETSKITNSVIENIENLEKESFFIRSIIDTINSIAEQTNLLALNASIEAARAGSAGDGFAVVAEEVRKLAEESLNASNRISEIINGINSLTQNTVEDLTSDIEKISLRIKDIEKTKNETEYAIGNISNVIRETAEASSKVQESADSQLSEAEFLNISAEELRKYSEELQDDINSFKIN